MKKKDKKKVITVYNDNEGRLRLIIGDTADPRNRDFVDRKDVEAWFNYMQEHFLYTEYTLKFL